MGNRAVEVRVSPYIPLEPYPASPFPVQGYFEISFSFSGGAQGGTGGKPVVEIGNFVRKSTEDTSAVFNHQDEFETFVETLQFEDTAMYRMWSISRGKEDGSLIIRKKTKTPLPQQGVCTVFSTAFHPTNLKGESGHAALLVCTRMFTLEADCYEVFSQKLYIADILTFRAEPERTEPGQTVHLSWDARGDYVDSALLYINEEMPKSVAISGSHDLSVSLPSTVRLQVMSRNPGFRLDASAWISIELKPPEIKSFTAEPPAVFQGKAVTLAWDTKASVNCQLNGQTEACPGCGEKVLAVSFSPGEKERKMRLTANGYRGKHPYAVSEEISIKRTFWEEKGIVSGLELPEGHTPDRMFFSREKAILFDGKAVCSSGDGTHWETISPLPEEQPVRAIYRSFLLEDDFLIPVLRGDGSLYIWNYCMTDRKWSAVRAAGKLDRMGACGFTVDQQGQQYLGFTASNCFYLLRRVENSYSVFFSYPLEGNAVGLDLCDWRGFFYFAVLDEKNRLTIYRMGKAFEEVIAYTVISPAKSCVFFLPLQNDLLIMDGEGVYQMEHGKRVEQCTGELLFAGMNRSPVMISRRGKTKQWYQLDGKEMLSCSNRMK